MAFSHQLVTTGTTLLLRALRAKQVTKAWRAANELALGGEFEPLGHGLLCLLHGERSKTEMPSALGKAFVREFPEFRITGVKPATLRTRGAEIRNPLDPWTTYFQPGSNLTAALDEKECGQPND